MINLLMWEHEMKKKSKNRDFYFLELVDFSDYCRLYSTVTRHVTHCHVWIRHRQRSHRRTAHKMHILPKRPSLNVNTVWGNCPLMASFSNDT